MPTTPQLPPLPEPDAYATEIAEGRTLYLPCNSLNFEGMASLFAASQLHARDRQIVELCASIAESDEFYGSAVQHAIASRIRALLGDKGEA